MPKNTVDDSSNPDLPIDTTIELDFGRKFSDADREKIRKSAVEAVRRILKTADATLEEPFGNHTNHTKHRDHSRFYMA